MKTVRDVLDAGAVHSVYQPIVDLQTGDIVAYEALARGPAGTPIERPDRLFAQARSEGLLDELEWACRAAAVRGALEAQMRNPASLFINVEPDALATGIPDEHIAIVGRGIEEMRIFVEITERAIASRPAELLTAVARMRELGAGIAIDDVGADERSLAVLPFLRADVIKLDLRLVQSRPSKDIAGIVHAVSAHAERTGARVLAEGIETEAHLATALALGATLGQGWHFGRPEPLPQRLPFVRPWAALPIQAIVPSVNATQTPFDIVHSRREVLEGDEAVLLSMSRQLEERAFELGPRAMILTAMQDARYASSPTLDRYRKLAQTGAFVGLFARGIDRLDLSGLAHGTLGEIDRLRHEWSVNVIAPHFSAALAARELDGSEPRRFAFALTHERELVIRMAQCLLARLDTGTDLDRLSDAGTITTTPE